MPKAEKGSIKWLANKMKSKGLQKLRWYCQMCQKQCRDENGFKCHTQSEAHQRQLLIFADNPNKFLHDFSKEFESNFINLLKRAHGTKRVKANRVYMEYIADKEHCHMNSTRWTTLTGFVLYLGKTGKCKIDETEEGWYISWIDRDPDTIARQERLAKKRRLDKDDEERMTEHVNCQVMRAREEVEKKGDVDNEPAFSEFHRDNEDDKVQLNLNLKDIKKQQESAKPVVMQGKSVFKQAASKSIVLKKEKDEKRKRSALDDIMEEEKMKKLKKEKEERKPPSDTRDYWLRPDIIVKITTKNLGDKFYKQKARVKSVVDKYAAVVVLMSDQVSKVKLDQEHLETVIPQPGRPVLVVNGKYRRETGVLRSIDVDNFSGRVELDEDGKVVQLPYEHFSKLYVPS